jgi:hypothetical protein
MQRRIREARKRQGYLSDAISWWTRGFDEDTINSAAYWYKQRMNPSAAEFAAFNKDLEDHIYTVLAERYEKRFHSNIPASEVIESIERDIYDDAKLEMVEWRLLSALDNWTKIYGPPEGTLKKLANDKQNVHTGVVNKQIDDANKVLNAITVPKGQRTVDEIHEAWTTNLHITWSQIEPVYFDMLHWGQQQRIYKAGDQLYRKMLRSLWALIKTYNATNPSIYKELLTRLWEECHESLEMCAHGHISRLTNVMVGFHSAFLSPQSTKEAFQDAIAAIANLDLPLKTKVAQATQLMEIHGIPEDERGPWLDAF